MGSQSSLTLNRDDTIPKIVISNDVARKIHRKRKIRNKLRRFFSRNFRFVNARVCGRADIERGRIESNSQASIWHEATLDPIVNPTEDCLARLPPTVLGSDHVNINGVMDAFSGQKHVNNKSLHGEMEESQSIASPNEVPYHNSRTNNKKTRIGIIGDPYAQKFRSVLGLVIDESCYRLESFIKGNMDTSDIAKNLFAQITDLNEKDFVIFMFTTKYVGNHAALRYSLRNLVSVSRVTNLIVMVEQEAKHDQPILRDIERYMENFRAHTVNFSLQCF
ncbi:hypothetical protein HHI36_009071 [Cryptolaemus montrouzieri]|uniref:Uncharacterized protein n=1 Tax=Cryptolaemus montrouzieri TaxID=559131 RepID=A0ABD2MUE0_9CUCU